MEMEREVGWVRLKEKHLLYVVILVFPVSALLSYLQRVKCFLTARRGAVALDF